jgi:hypothetical protein
MSRPDQWKRVGAYLVLREELTHDVVGFSVYEELAGHGGVVLTGPEGHGVGPLMSRPLPSMAERVSGPYRWQMADAHQKALQEVAYLAIETVYPEARRGIRNQGEIELALGTPRMWRQS